MVYYNGRICPTVAEAFAAALRDDISMRLADDHDYPLMGKEIVEKLELDKTEDD